MLAREARSRPRESAGPAVTVPGVGRRSRNRARAGEPDAATEVVATTDYADAEGNVLTLRDALSARSLAKLAAEPGGRAGASAEDRSKRRRELLFERLVVRWTIAGLPIERQGELLARLRMAGSEERRWVFATIDRHVREKLPELAGG